MYYKMKNKIIIFHPYPDFGGADRSVIRLINGLDNCDIHLCTLIKPKYKNYLNKKIKYKILKSTRTLFSIFELRKYVLEETKSDNYFKYIFISNQNFANIISMISLAKYKKIKTILIERNHIVELSFYNNLFDKFKKFLIYLGIKYFYNKASAIVGISKVLSNDLSKLINKSVTTIYNPAADRDIFENKNHFNHKKYFKKLKKKKILLNVGRLENQKNQIFLLEAFKDCVKSDQQLHLIIVGNGNQYKELEKFIKKNNLSNNVDIIKNISNLKIFYKKSNLFILTSIYEGFGNVLVEALKYKCPIISSNCLSGPKEILNNGKFGDLYNPGDKKKLIILIKKHLINEKKLKKKSIAGFKELSKYSLKENILNFKKLFNKL